MTVIHLKVQLTWSLMTNKITLVLITLKILAKLLLLFATPTPPTPTSPFSLTHFCLVLLTQANHFIWIKSRASLVHRTWNRKSLRSSIHMVFDFQLWFATCFFLNKNLEAPFNFDFFSSHLQTLFVSWEELHTTTFFFFGMLLPWQSLSHGVKQLSQIWRWSAL